MDLSKCSDCFVRWSVKQEILNYTGNFQHLTGNASRRELSWALLSYGKGLIWMAGLLDGKDKDRRICELGEHCRVTALELLNQPRSHEGRLEIIQLQERVAHLENLILRQERRAA